MSDDPLPWRVPDPDDRRAWATAIAPSVEVDRVRRIIVAAATCPTCHHGFTATFTEDDLLLNRHGRDEPWEGDIPFTIACGCRAPHPGRPGHVERGCGAAGAFTDTE
jgi:hypothetical protein